MFSLRMLFGGSLPYPFRKLHAGKTRSIDLAIDRAVAHHHLHVFPGFRERNGIHKFGRLVVSLSRFPSRHAIFARIIGGQCRFQTAVARLQSRQIHRSEAKIVLRLKQAGAGETNLNLLGHFFRGGWDQLHQAHRSGVRKRFRLERRLLADQSSYLHGIDASTRGRAFQLRSIRKGIRDAPNRGRDLAEGPGFQLRNDLTNGDKSDAIATGFHGFLGRLEQQAGRSGGYVSGSKFHFRGGIEGNRVQGDGSIAARGRGRRDIFIQRRRGWQQWDLPEDCDGVRKAGADGMQPFHGSRAKIILGVSIRQLREVSAGQRFVPRSLGNTAQPVDGVGNVS